MAAGANTAASLRNGIAKLCMAKKGFSARLSATFIDAKPHHKDLALLSVAKQCTQKINKEERKRKPETKGERPKAHLDHFPPN